MRAVREAFLKEGTLERSSDTSKEGCKWWEQHVQRPRGRRHHQVWKGAQELGMHSNSRSTFWVRS